MVKVATLNIAGISSVENRRALLNFLKYRNIDIACLQEVTFKQCPLLEAEYEIVFNLGPKKLGTAMLLRRGLRAKSTLKEPEGRLISVELEGLNYVCVYAPSGSEAKLERDIFLRQTVPAYVLTSKKPAVIMGDFNTMEELGQRRGNATRPRENAAQVAAMKDMVKGLEVSDVWNLLRPNEHGYTYHCSRSSARLDRIYANNPTIFNEIYTEQLPFGDHLAVVAQITPGVNSNERVIRDFGQWKLNTSILSEEAYRLHISKFVGRIEKLPLRAQDVCQWWEHEFKPGLKRETIKYCVIRARNQRKMREFLQECLSEVVNAEPFDWSRYLELKCEFRAWEVSALRGYAVRSRTEDYTTEETPSIFHVRRTKLNNQQSKISKIRSEAGNDITTEPEITQAILNHFDSIFKNQAPPDYSFSAPFIEGVRGVLYHLPSSGTALSMSRVAQGISASASPHEGSGSIPSSTAVSLLTAQITPAEISTALIACKSNKSPGTDGIPYEFYSKFWDIIGNHFCAMVVAILNRGSVLPSQGEAAIKLIPKTRNPMNMSDYRPISILNTDYKLIASVLAHRLRKLLPEALQVHQKGGVPGRYIFDSLCLFRDIIEDATQRANTHIHCPHTHRHRIKYGAAIIAFDFEKAYDLVNRKILWKIMSVMGFPDTFITWLQGLYTTCTISPMNGNTRVGNIENAGSLRQGCPLSVHLFTLYIEPLLVALQSNLEGICVHGHKVAVRAFVDDLTVIVKSDNDILRAWDLVNAFCSWTRMRVNKAKSKLLGIGDWAFEKQLKIKDSNLASRKSGDKPVPKVWPVQWLEPVSTLKLLGINFSASIKETQKLEWAKMCHKMLGILMDNGDRKFTLLGRVLFFKQHVLALAVHLAQVIPCPISTAEKIRAQMTSFVWKGHIKPNRNASFREKRKGGLGVPNPLLFFRSLFAHNVFKALVERQTLSNMDSASHRKIYASLIADIAEPGRMELKRPDLDWNRIWNWVAARKGESREILFLFNHDLLPTNERKKRRNQISSPLCPMCQLNNETVYHLMLCCPYRGEIASWLARMLRSLGCAVPIQDALHGHIGDCREPRPTLTLLENYITEVWKHRKRLSVPPVSGLEDLWETLRR